MTIVKVRGENINRLIQVGFYIIFSFILAHIMIIAWVGQTRAEDYPGFGLHGSFNQYTEITVDHEDVEVAQGLVQIVYHDPQFLRLAFGLGQEEIEIGKAKIDDALCFQAGGTYYLAPSLELGIPADFSISAEYSRARHDYNQDDKLTHQRLIGTFNLEWDFPPAVPYIRVGALYAALDSPSIEEERTNPLFIGGVRFNPTQWLRLGLEFNLSEDIGFGGSVGLSF